MSKSNISLSGSKIEPIEIDYSKLHSEIQGKFSGKALEALTWAIIGKPEYGKSHWEKSRIAVYKWNWSSEAKCDIGTPSTVKRFVDDKFYVDHSDPISTEIRAKITLDEVNDFYRFATMGYLLYHDWQGNKVNVRDLDCTNIDEAYQLQLGGELKRYGVRESIKLNPYQPEPDPKSIKVDNKIVEHFCKAYDLGDRAIKLFNEKLKI